MPLRDGGTGATGGTGGGDGVTSHRAVFAAACLGMLLFGVTLTTLVRCCPL